jgi:predicted acetyltransferase
LVTVKKETEISDREQTVSDKEWSQAKQSREANALKATYEDLLKKLETREQRLTFKEQILTNAYNEAKKKGII